MARGSYGLQRILTLANGTSPGMLSSALWSKISAMLGINTLTLPLRLTGSTASIDAATGAAPGSMSAADKAKLDAATSANTASALVQRDTSGNFSAGTITATLAGGATTAITAANANALNAGTTDGDKLHGLGTLQAAILGGDLVLSSAGWLASGLVLTLSPGKWWVSANVLVGDGAAVNDFAAAVFMDVGPPVTPMFASGQVTTQGAGKLASMTMAGYIDCGAYSPTIRLSVLVNAPGANAKLKASPSLSAIGNATTLTAVRVG